MDDVDDTDNVMDEVEERGNVMNEAEDRENIMDEVEDVEKPTKAGSIRKISVENFMCHSSLTIELGDRVNFITGQNGSGKSAILTALCVAFGIKAKGTQRANSVKDFIKNGCRYGQVMVELSNVGEDAFKREVFGDKIFVERRIIESGSSFCLKDCEGKKVAGRKSDIEEVVEHFNIEVENPCVIMTQDKSREFLHGGSTEKDKFKFFYKATLLQNVNELLTRWEEDLTTAEVIVESLFADLQPTRNELKQIEEQLKTLEEVGVLRSEIEKLEKIYAWTWVKDAEFALREAEDKLVELRTRIPLCQRKIDDWQVKVDLKNAAHDEKQAFIDGMANNAQQLRQAQGTLDSALKEALRERVQVNEDTKRVRRSLQEAKDRLRRLEHDISEIHQRMAQDTQAELNEKLQVIQALEDRKKSAQEEISRLQEEEMALTSEVEALVQQSSACMREVQEQTTTLRDLRNHIRGLESQQTNTVTAFGGENVLRLLEAIEQNVHKFTRPPLGPIGAHVALLNKEWSLAVEVAVGRLFDDFVVTNHKDLGELRAIGNRTGCRGLGILTASFDRPRIVPPPNMVPDASLLTVLSSLQSENPIITNILIDQGRVERKVLVEDYNAGKSVAFNAAVQNVSEVITADGVRMYSRGGAETILPRDRRIRGGRLGVRVDEQIMQAQVQEIEVNSGMLEAQSRKRKLDQDLERAREKADTVKRRRRDRETAIRRQDFEIQDLKKALTNESDNLNKESSMIEIEEEIERAREEMQSKEDALQKSEIQLQLADSKCADAKSKQEEFSESARGAFESFSVAEQDLVTLKDEIAQALESVKNYQNVMQHKVVSVIQNQEKIVEDQLKEVEKYRAQAAEICPLELRESLGEDNRTRDQLSNQMKRLKETVTRQENETEEEGDLIHKANKIRRRIASREKRFTNLKEKLEMLKEALHARKNGYRKNCELLKRQLTWGFNRNLGRKGFTGSVKIDFEKKTLHMNVLMPQDSSNSSVRDTRALSGGERSFSTLAFALAVHNMTEAPFRAMDEFDVFMDAVSRKISLDTVVDFALRQGSQWIFITPHDISMVKGDVHVKKQQMPDPRP